MNDLNTIILEGMIVKDPSHRTTKKNDPVCSLSVASSRFFKAQGQLKKETSVFEIEAWGAEAEKCQSLAHKGRRCRIAGKLRQERWEAPDGAPRAKVVIVAELIEFRPEAKQKEGNYEPN